MKGASCFANGGTYFGAARAKPDVGGKNQGRQAAARQNHSATGRRDRDTANDLKPFLCRYADEPGLHGCVLPMRKPGIIRR